MAACHTRVSLVVWICEYVLAWFCVDLIMFPSVYWCLTVIAFVCHRPYNTPDRIAEYTYSKDPGQDTCCKGDLYLDFIEREIIPFARKNLRIISSAASISANTSEEAALSALRMNSAPVGILGSSLGGLISCYAGWTRPSVYSAVGCMISSFWYASLHPLGLPSFPLRLCLSPS